jgi:hypothetical protein
MFGRSKEENVTAHVDSGSDTQPYADPLAEIPKSRWERLWPVLACGSGLFSDGYINNVDFPKHGLHLRYANVYLGHWVCFHHSRPPL